MLYSGALEQGRYSGTTKFHSFIIVGSVVSNMAAAKGSMRIPAGLSERKRTSTG